MQDVNLRSYCLPAEKDIRGNKRVEWPQCCFPCLLHLRVETCVSSGQVRCFASSCIVVGMGSGLLVCKCCFNLIWDQCGTCVWRLIFCIQMRDTFQINLHRHRTLFLSFYVIIYRHMHRMFHFLCMTRKQVHRHSEFYFCCSTVLICLKMVLKAICYGYSKDLKISSFVG